MPLTDLATALASASSVVVLADVLQPTPFASTLDIMALLKLLHGLLHLLRLQMDEPRDISYLLSLPVVLLADGRAVAALAVASSGGCALRWRVCRSPCMLFLRGCACSWPSNHSSFSRFFDGCTDRGWSRRSSCICSHCRRTRSGRSRRSCCNTFWFGGSDDRCPRPLILTSGTLGDCESTFCGPGSFLRHQPSAHRPLLQLIYSCHNHRADCTLVPAHIHT